jgi:hypothetical protein
MFVLNPVAPALRMNVIYKLICFAINLQLFADAGTLVNATGNYVNAYTGDTTPFEGVNTLSGELKTFYDTELLENARIEMFYAQFGKKQTLSANRGKTVEWRKWNTFEKAGQLTEGVIPTGQKFGMSSKTGAINQYGTYASISDVLELRAYDDVILGATEEMGASAAETQETLIRDALLTNTNVLYCDNIKKDGTFVSTPTSCATMGVSDTDGYSLLTPDMVAKAVTKMKKDRVPTINGNDGTAYFMVYEGDGSGTGRETSSGWQNNRKTADYVGEIAQYFNASRLKPVKTTGLGREAFFDHMADHSGAKCVEEQD